MADVFTKQKRSEIMSAIRSRGNKDTELKLAFILRAYRITGWRRHQRVLGNPDFIFRRQRLAIFVDGCFWHGCHRHGHLPKSNREYWHEKISRNTARDRFTTRFLQNAGWRVLRIWAHSLRFPRLVARRVVSRLENRGVEAVSSQSRASQ
jgi:DNA mismatch endonuclease (patch repair protein)